MHANGEAKTMEEFERLPMSAPAVGKTALLAKQPLAFELASVDDAWRMATMLAKSQLLPETLQERPSDVLVILMTGRELGLSPMQSLRLISVVKGKPYLEAKLKIGLVKRSSECVYLRCTETSSERATFETERASEGKTSLTFTAAEARAAGLLGRTTRSGEPDNWAKYTATMLRWRAASALCDLVYPDIVGGIGTSDELDEVRRSEPPRTYAPPRPPEEPRIVGSGSTARAAKAPEPEQKTAPDEAAPHDPVTGEVKDEPAPAMEQAASAPKPSPAGDDPDSFTDRLLGDMRGAVEANNLSALTKLAAKAKEVPADRQDEVLKTYQAAKQALKEKAQKGGAA